MKAMLYGFAAIVVIAVGADSVLGALGCSSADRFSGSSVRN